MTAAESSASATTSGAANAAAAYQYPQGHLAHLNPKQQQAFDEFKRLCQDRGIYQPATSQGARASHGDATILRYLRARKFDQEGAYKQFADTEQWRKECDIGKIYDRIDVDEFDATAKLYPQWTGRRDKRGMPVYLFEVGDLSSQAISAYEHSTKLKGGIADNSHTPAKLLRLFALYEHLTRFATPWCTATFSDRPHPETPITQGNNIIDIGGVGLKQFWDLKAHLQDASTLATAHYPETLDRIFVIGAPSFFPTIWNWAKRWFDPIVVSKMFILSDAEILPTLSKFIDPENIPKKYGGTLDFKFGDGPRLDPSMIGDIEWVSGNGGQGEKSEGRMLPLGPMIWRENNSGEVEMVAVGTVNGQVREEVVGKLKGRTYDEVFFVTNEGNHKTAAEASGAAGDSGPPAQAAVSAGIPETNASRAGGAAGPVHGEQNGAVVANGVGLEGNKDIIGRASIDSARSSGQTTPAKPTAPGPPATVA